MDNYSFINPNTLAILFMAPLTVTGSIAYPNQSIGIDTQFAQESIYPNDSNNHNDSLWGENYDFKYSQDQTGSIITVDNENSHQIDYLINFVTDLSDNSQELPHEINKVIDDNIWDLF